MAVYYAFRWIEAVTRPTNDARVVTKFFKKVIFPQFDIPRFLISDGGTHFIKRKFKAMLTKYEAHRKKGLGYHP